MASYLSKLLEDVLCGADYEPFEMDNEESNFDKLADKIQDKEDVSKDSADAIAAKIGQDKYGKQGMEDKAKAGKEKAQESK